MNLNRMTPNGSFLKQCLDYWCHIHVEDFRESGHGVRVNATRVDQSMHPGIVFENIDNDGAENIYRGDSISEGWAAIEETMGPVEIPGRLDSFLQ